MPAHPLFRQLLKLTGRPLAAPSANPFGYVSPTTAEHVRSGLGRKIAHILDGGSSRIGLESTIVDLRNAGTPRLLRPGEITRRQLEKVLGIPLRGPMARRGKSSAGQIAPGQLARHYSPRTPLILHARLTPAPPPRGVRARRGYFCAAPAACAAPRSSGSILRAVCPAPPDGFFLCCGGSTQRAFPRCTPSWLPRTASAKRS